MSDVTIVSAPGKVLLTGGYLVLDPAHSGLVIATSSRFYCIIRTRPSTSAPSASTANIVVKSPQFDNAVWKYAVDSNDTAQIEVRPLACDGGRNKFVEIALQKTLSLIEALDGQMKPSQVFDTSSLLEIVIVGDNDFYSQRRALEALSLPACMSSLDKIEPFACQNTPISEVHKTGLGSSAALITSLVTALLRHFRLSPDLDLIHNMAQYVHCFAQCKVGSGFDVCSAVKGSQVYTRFDEKVLRGLMDKTEVTGQEIRDTVTPSPLWTTRSIPIALPPNIRLVLADVDAGSDTPSLVGKVLKWRKENPESANSLWSGLNSANQLVETQLRSLSRLAEDKPEEYRTALRTASRRSSTTTNNLSDETSLALRKLSETLQAVRKLMKQMGEASGVPIEPDEQTRLLDACLEIPGVIGGGVPGAGGYDAIYLLVVEGDAFPQADEEKANTIAQVESLWQGWKELSVCPLTSRADAGGLQIIDNADTVRGLRTILNME